MLVVHKASWPGEELIIRGTFGRHPPAAATPGGQPGHGDCQPQPGRATGPRSPVQAGDASFTHRFRKARCACHAHGDFLMQTPATPLGTHHGARHEDTILLIGHGSREPEGNDEIHRFVAQWRTRPARLEYRGVLHRVCAQPARRLAARRTQRPPRAGAAAHPECGRPCEDGDS